MDNNTIGALDLTAEEGKIAFCNGQQTENGIYNIKDAETVIEFSQIAEVTPTPTASPTAGPITEPTATPTVSPTPEQSAKLTENGAEVSADIALEKFEGGERILAAVYNSDRQLVTAKITEITETVIIN